MNYLVKNKKYTFMIIFFISIFFIPFKVSALVHKGSDYFTYSSGETLTGTITQNNNSTKLYTYFSNNHDFTDYDIIAIKPVKFNFTYNNFVSFDNPIFSQGNYELTCLQNNGQYCSKYSYHLAGSQSLPQDLYGTIEEGSISFSIELHSADENNVNNCYFSSDMDGTILCPTTNMTNASYWFIKVNTDTVEDVHYYIDYNRVIDFYNYESSEIIGSLGGVSSNVNATTSAIEAQTQQQAQHNAFMESTSTSGAQSTASTEITALSGELTQHMSQFSELTQLVVSPITLFMELNNDVCTPLTLQVPFVGGTAVLPCIKPIMQQYFGGLYSVFTTVIATIICYWVFVKTVALIKSFLDADDDKIEVIDL